MPHVFISYVREDSASVDRLAQELASCGIQVWLDRLSIKPGQRWATAIREAVRSGDYFIACFSENSVTKLRSGMNQELGLAIDELMLRPLNRTWFLPVVLSRCEIPDYEIGGNATLRSIQYVALYDNWNDGVEKIIEVIAPERAREIIPSERRRQILSDFYHNAGEYEDVNDIIAALATTAPTRIYAIPPVNFWYRRKGFGQATITAVTRIAALGVVPFLEDLLHKVYDTYSKGWILQTLALLGDTTALPLVLNEYINWVPSSKDIVGNANAEGPHLCSLFPYRELHAVTFYGDAAIDLLLQENNSGTLTRRIRSCAALAIINPANSREYEATICEGLKLGGKEAYEALFAARCFGNLLEDHTRSQILSALHSEDPSVRTLALKLFFDRHQAEELKRATLPLLDNPVHFNGLSSLWEDVYYIWDA